MTAKRKGGGGKLSRSEVVTVRLDPKLRFAAELVARTQRRTISSFIEWAIEKAVGREALQEWGSDDEYVYALEAANQIWDVEDADRLVKIAERFPNLLNFEEGRIWKLILETPYFIEQPEVKYDKKITLSGISNPHRVLFRRVREQWDLLKKIAADKESEDALPELPADEVDVTPF